MMHRFDTAARVVSMDYPGPQSLRFFALGYSLAALAGRRNDGFCTAMEGAS